MYKVYGSVPFVARVVNVFVPREFVVYVYPKVVCILCVLDGSIMNIVVES